MTSPIEEDPTKLYTVLPDGKLSVWSNKPDCLCFLDMADERMMTIDMALKNAQPAMRQAINEAHICGNAVHYMIGAMVLYALGAALRERMGLSQDDVLALNVEQEAAALAIIDAACLNARERLLEMNGYVNRRLGREVDDKTAPRG